MFKTNNVTKSILISLLALVFFAIGAALLLNIPKQQNSTVYAAETKIDGTSNLYYNIVDGTLSVYNKSNIPEAIPAMFVENNYQGWGDLASISHLVIGQNISEIGFAAFHEAGFLTSVVIPDGVTSIGEYSFMSCSFASLTIPGSVHSIGSCAFSELEMLKSLTLEYGVSGISVEAFTGLNNLEEIWTACSEYPNGIELGVMGELEYETWYKYKSTDGSNIVSDGSVSYQDVKSTNGEYMHFFKTSNASDSDLFVLTMDADTELASSSTNLWNISGSDNTVAYKVCVNGGVYGKLPTASNNSQISWTNHSSGSEVNFGIIIANTAKLDGVVSTDVGNTGVIANIILPTILAVTLVSVIAMYAVGLKKRKHI